MTDLCINTILLSYSYCNSCDLMICIVTVVAVPTGPITLIDYICTKANDYLVLNLHTCHKHVKEYAYKQIPWAVCVPSGIHTTKLTLKL